MTDVSINSKYYIVKPDANPYGFFSNFKAYQRKRRGTRIRTPFPIIISNPGFYDTLTNFSKAELGTYVTIMSVSFFGSMLISRTASSMSIKLYRNHIAMHIANLLSIYLCFVFSYCKLSGKMDNGMRWRRAEYVEIYDFTSDLEKTFPFYILSDQRKI